MNRRSFFKGLAAVFAAAVAPFKVRAAPEPVPEWVLSYLRFTQTPHADRIDWEHLDSSDLWGFEEGVLDRIKVGADASAKLRLEIDSKLEPLYLLPSDEDSKRRYRGWRGANKERGIQTQFADGRPWAPLKEDLRAALRAAMNNPVADTGAIQGTSDRV